MTGYKMNFTTRTLTITKAFGAKAMITNSEEASLVQHLRTMIPDLKITYRTHIAKKPNSHKGLSYSKMAEYIKQHENADEILAVFKSVKEISKVQLSPYSYVCKWFMTQFPDYKKIPTFHEGKITAVDVIFPQDDNKTAKEMDVAMIA